MTYLKGLLPLHAAMTSVHTVYFSVLSYLFVILICLLFIFCMFVSFCRSFIELLLSLKEELPAGFWEEVRSSVEVTYSCVFLVVRFCHLL